MRYLHILAIVIIISINSYASISPITGSTSTCLGNTVTLSDATIGGRWSTHILGFALVDSITGVVTGIAVGTIVITYTVDTNFVTTYFTINPVPDVSLCPTTVCVGSIAMFSIAPGIMISSNPSIASIVSSGIKGVSAGTAIISYILPAGCMATKVMTVNPMPSAPSIIGTSTYCICDSFSGFVVITDTMASVVLWYPTDSGGIGTTSYPLINTCIAGLHSLFASQTVLGCESPRDSISITVDSCALGLLLPKETNEVFVYPNPTTGNLFIDLHLPTNKIVKITIFDILGNEIYQEFTSQTKTEINILDFIKGIYFISVKGNGINYFNKLAVFK